MEQRQINQVLDGVGARLRTFRERRELRLADVSAATNISVGILSRLESGLRRPSLDLLLPLADAYRVPIDELVGAPGLGDPRVHPRAIRRHGVVYLPLSPGAPVGVEAFKLIMPGRDPDSPMLAKTHHGYEWVYVLNGTLHLKLAETLTVVETGQAAEFDTRLPHAMGSASRNPVELLALFSTQGERIHVHDE